MIIARSTNPLYLQFTCDTRKASVFNLSLYVFLPFFELWLFTVYCLMFPTILFNHRALTLIVYYILYNNNSLFLIYCSSMIIIWHIKWTKNWSTLRNIAESDLDDEASSLKFIKKLKIRKCNDKYLLFGFTYICNKNVERLACVLCPESFSNESMKSAKLRSHLQTT